MDNLFKFSTRHGAPEWSITVYSILLMVISIGTIVVVTNWLMRDIKRLKQMDPKRDKLTDILRAKDQIFGWIIGISMGILVTVASISRLV